MVPVGHSRWQPGPVDVGDVCARALGHERQLGGRGFEDAAATLREARLGSATDAPLTSLEVAEACAPSCKGVVAAR
jgi:hypothetical protein